MRSWKAPSWKASQPCSDMLHQTIPAYNGSQPFLYACYSEDDEALAFPVLARMYNEGFRIWCARAGGVEEGFRSMQRLSACSCAMLFFSQSTLNAVKFGDSEMRAVTGSAKLRVVVSLDSTEADSSLFPLSVPENVPYVPTNDAGFWLRIYSSDVLEKCRGPWPEKKLLLRDAVIEDAEQEAVTEEYRELEAILGDTGFEQEPEPEPEPEPVPKDDDDLVYIPLGKVQAAKSGLDLEYDAVLEMLDRVVRQQETLAVELNSVADEIEQKNNEAAALIASETAKLEESVKAAEPVQAPSQAPADTVVSSWRPSWGSRNTAAPAPLIPDDDRFPEHPLMQGDPVPKTDRSVEVPDIPEAPAALVAKATPANAPIAEASDENTVGEEKPADNEIPPPEPLMFTPVIVVPAEPEEPAEPEPEPEADAEEAEAEDDPAEDEQEQPQQTVVPVLVKRQRNKTVRVIPIKHLRMALPDETHAAPPRPAMRLSSPVRSGFKSAPITGTIEFEQYVRNIALSAIAQETASRYAPASAPRYVPAAAPAPRYVPADRSSAEPEQPVKSARKHRGRALPAEAMPQGIVAPEMPAMSDLPVPVSSDVLTGVEGEKPSPRKNKHPHRPGGWLAGVIAALRGQHDEAAVITDEAAPTDVFEPIEAEQEAVRVPVTAHPKAPTLEAAIENFVEKDPPRAVTVTVVPRSRRPEE